MNKNFLIALTIFSFNSYGNALPEHDMALINYFEQENTEISKQDIDHIMSEFEMEFQKDFKQKNLRLKMLNDWDEPMINALAYQNLPVAHVDFLGGMARHKLMTKRVVKNILCHEMGHHLAGNPMKEIKDGEWMSAEGQADYYATYECLRRINKNSYANINTLDLPVTLKDKCIQRYSLKSDQAICMESIKAAFETLNVFYSITTEVLFTNEVKPDWLSRDFYQVEFTERDYYPSLQCRLDTMIEGALCDDQCKKNSLEPNLVIAPYSGYRPTCWFNHKEFQQKPITKNCKFDYKKFNCDIKITAFFNGSKRQSVLKADCGKNVGGFEYDKNEILSYDENNLSVYGAYGISSQGYDFDLKIEYDKETQEIKDSTFSIAKKKGAVPTLTSKLMCD